LTCFPCVGVPVVLASNTRGYVQNLMYFYIYEASIHALFYAMGLLSRLRNGTCKHTANGRETLSNLNCESPALSNVINRMIFADQEQGPHI